MPPTSCARRCAPAASGCRTAADTPTRDLDAEARLHDGELIAETDTDVDTARLGKLIEQRLLEIDLPELLIEVDGWTDFSDHLAPLSGNRSRSPDMPCVLYAAIIAQATNLGLTGMARASDFSYQQLEWACEQYCREQTLTTASACLVDYHHQLLSRLESSSRRNPLARALQDTGG